MIWKNRTTSERLSLAIVIAALLWVGWLALGNATAADDPGESFVYGLLAVILLVVFFICTVPAAIAMLFWGGRANQGWWRDTLDRILPLLTLSLLVLVFVLLARAG